jgi:hypothetical protein
VPRRRWSPGHSVKEPGRGAGRTERATR